MEQLLIGYVAPADSHVLTNQLLRFVVFRHFDNPTKLEYRKHPITFHPLLVGSSAMPLSWPLHANPPKRKGSECRAHMRRRDTPGKDTHALTDLNEDALDVLRALCGSFHVDQSVILGVLMRLLELHLPETADGKKTAPGEKKTNGVQQENTLENIHQNPTAVGAPAEWKTAVRLDLAPTGLTSWAQLRQMVDNTLKFSLHIIFRKKSGVAVFSIK